MKVASRMDDLSITKRTAKRTTVNDQHVPLTIPTHAAHLSRVLADGATRKQVSTHTSIIFNPLRMIRIRRQRQARYSGRLANQQHWETIILTGVCTMGWGCSP